MPEPRAKRASTQPEVRFDGRRAKTYEPFPVPKRARIVRAKRNEQTTIVAEWGEEQHFVGTWVAVLDDTGEIRYGSAHAEWMDMHERVPGRRNLWQKTASVRAYQHQGTPGRLTTILADGTRETTNRVRAGDWIVKQRNDEVQVIPDADFRRRYDADHPRKRTIDAR
jgi:hypothetical protein